MSAPEKNENVTDQTETSAAVALGADEVPEEEFTPGADDMGAFGEGAPARKPKNFLPSAKRLFGLFAPHKVKFTIVVALVAASVVLTVIAPKILGQAMDVIFDGAIGRALSDFQGMDLAEVAEILRQQGQDDFADMLEGAAGVIPGVGIDFTRLAELIGIVLAMYVVASVLMWAQGYILNRIVMDVIYNLRKDIEEKLHRLPLSYFDTRQRGDLMSRVTNDVDNMQQALQQAFSQLVQSALQVLGIGIMMFVVSWQLGLLALIALPLSAIIAGVVGSRSQKLFTQQWKSTGDLNGHIEESYSGLELVRVFGRDKEMLEEFDKRNETLFSSSFGAQFVSGMIMPLMQFVNYLQYVLIAVAGGLRVASGTMTLGDATAFIQYSREFAQPLGQIAGMANMLISGVASAERTFELLDAEEQEPDVAEAHLPARTDGHVEFDRVSFSYSAHTPLIENLSFSVEPGQTVAIVGPTGAGKTTLVNLVMRFYELDGGRILLDGVDTTKLSRAELRAQVGMVLQDTWLFDGSIMENIRYGRLDATDEEVIAAAEATMVDRFVRQLPEGYETPVTSDEGSISAGERQLITIARAFLANPSLLILDEATSSVDTRTELLVQHAMNALRTDRTSFVIAHRLSTIRDADTILMMEQGRIVERGSHEELLAAKGAYHDLYMTQFLGGIEPENGAEPAGVGAAAWGTPAEITSTEDAVAGTEQP